MTSADELEAAFDHIAARMLAEDPTIERGRMFGSAGLKTERKVFAMIVKGELVVRLTADRVQELLRAGTGRPFDPGHGRRMKRWVALRPPDEPTAERHVREARSGIVR